MKEDLVRNTIVTDALDILSCAYRSVASQDKAGSVQALHNMEAMFSNTTKHCFIGPDGKKNIEQRIDMAAFIQGGRENLKKRPIVTFNLCPTSPLQLNPTATDALILGARAGIPCNIISMALSGATSSVTLAGTLVTQCRSTVCSGPQPAGREGSTGTVRQLHQYNGYEASDDACRCA